jgi:single-strand DNA-binding protein
MINNIEITATGNVVNEPLYFEEKEGRKAMVSFRFASTPRYYNAQDQEWVDGTTTWFDVNAYGSLADNVNASISKGQPLVITGVLRTRIWTDSDGTDHSSNLLKVTAVGHNLALGTAVFERKKVTDEYVAQSIGAVSEESENEK